MPPNTNARHGSARTRDKAPASALPFISSASFFLSQVSAVLGASRRHCHLGLAAVGGSLVPKPKLILEPRWLSGRQAQGLLTDGRQPRPPSPSTRHSAGATTFPGAHESILIFLKITRKQTFRLKKMLQHRTMDSFSHQCHHKTSFFNFFTERRKDPQMSVRSSVGLGVGANLSPSSFPSCLPSAVISSNHTCSDREG